MEQPGNHYRLTYGLHLSRKAMATCHHSDGGNRAACSVDLCSTESNLTQKPALCHKLVVRVNVKKLIFKIPIRVFKARCRKSGRNSCKLLVINPGGRKENSWIGGVAKVKDIEEAVAEGET